MKTMIVAVSSERMPQVVPNKNCFPEEIHLFDMVMIDMMLFQLSIYHSDTCLSLYLLVWSDKNP